MTGLGNILLFVFACVFRGELLVIINLEVPEADVDDVAGLVLCNWTFLVATYSGARERESQCSEACTV